MAILPLFFISLFSTLVAGDISEATSNKEPILLAIPDKRGYRVWDDKGSVGRYSIIVWEASAPPNDWYLLGQRAQSNYKDLQSPTFSFKTFRNATLTENVLVAPTGFSFIWDSRGGSTYEPGSVWRLTCPPGFVALGDFFHRDARLSEPPSELYRKSRCVREELTERCAGWKPKVWDNAGAFADKRASVWTTEASSSTGKQLSFLYANTEHNIRPNIIPRCLRKVNVRDV